MYYRVSIAEFQAVLSQTLNFDDHRIISDGHYIYFNVIDRLFGHTKIPDNLLEILDEAPKGIAFYNSVISLHHFKQLSYRGTNK